jgi:hypothetical protein
MSYGREDRQLIAGLRAGLQRLRHEVWVDDRLGGGQEWWAEILRQIELCDAIVVAVSPALLESQACAAERLYAQQLGKAVLPVCVRRVRNELLPPDLAPLHVIDYCDPGVDAAFELANAVIHIPTSPALPHPMPAPPVIPVSYLSDLTVRVHATTLTLDEQLAIVARLGAALRKEAERGPALELLNSLQQRDDLYVVPAREIEKLLASVPPTDDMRDSSPDDGPAVPADWYADPTYRHQLRWFDKDWTDWVSDGGRVTEDPL